MDTTPSISVIIEAVYDGPTDTHIVDEATARRILGELDLTIRSIDGVENHDEQGNFFYIEFPVIGRASISLVQATLEETGEATLEYDGCLVQFQVEEA